MTGTVRNTTRGGGGTTTNIVNEIVEQIFVRDGVISGCQVVWLGDLDFRVLAGTIQIEGQTYTIAETDITLAVADGTHPRIDVIAADITAGPAAVKITGVAAADPAQPEVDPDTQIFLTFVTVAAGATTPTGVAEEQVYLDNAGEWTATASNARIDPDDVTDPDQGTKAVFFDAAQSGDNIVFADSALHSSLEYDALILRRKNVLANTINQDRMRVALRNDGDRVSSWVDVRNEDFGFSGSDLASYQTLSIPIEEFELGGSQFDEVAVQIQTNGGRTLSFLLDNIRWQTGLSIIIQGVTQEDVDQAVLAKPEQISIACTAIDGDIANATTYARWKPRIDIELLSVKASVAIAPTGAAAIIDIHAGGTTVMSTNKINIDAGEFDSTDAGTQPALTTTNIDAGTEVLVIVDQAGSSVAGAGLVVDIVYRQR